MSAGRLLLAFALAWALFAALGTPLRRVLAWVDADAFGLRMRAAEGSLWQGRLREASLRGAALGDIGVRLSPLPLLWGERRWLLTGDALEARVVDGRQRGVERLDGRLHWPSATLAQGLALTVHAQRVDLLFEGDACRRADGRTVLALASRVDAPPLLQLEGTWRCRDRDAVLALKSLPTASPHVDAEAELRIAADGRARLHASVRSPTPETRLLLEAAGFQPGPGGLGRSFDGPLFARPAAD